MDQRSPTIHSILIPERMVGQVEGHWGSLIVPLLQRRRELRPTVKTGESCAALKGAGRKLQARAHALRHIEVRLTDMLHAWNCGSLTPAIA